jgi:hypothetical protein
MAHTPRLSWKADSQLDLASVRLPRELAKGGPEEGLVEIAATFAKNAARRPPQINA